ncbi:unnamed protein product, partial [Polarella glacialis]
MDVKVIEVPLADGGLWVDLGEQSPCRPGDSPSPDFEGPDKAPAADQEALFVSGTSPVTHRRPAPLPPWPLPPPLPVRTQRQPLFSGATGTATGTATATGTGTATATATAT